MKQLQHFFLVVREGSSEEYPLQTTNLENAVNKEYNE